MPHGAAYRFRPSTVGEQYERITDRIEDTL